MTMLRELLNEIGEWCQSEEADVFCTLLERETGGSTKKVRPKSRLTLLEEHLRSPEVAEESARLDAELKAQDNSATPNSATE